MMCFGVEFVTVLFLTLQGPALSSVWVKHWSTQGQYRVGDTATLHCTIFSDEETIEDCDMEWVMLHPDNPNRTINIMEIKLYAGRITIQNNEEHTTIMIQNLGLNDTAPLCSIDCFLDGQLMRNVGRGGILKIVEPDPQDKEPSLYWLSYVLLTVNILIFLTVTVICSTLICRGLCRK